MRKRSASALIFLTLMLCLFTARPSSLKAHASNGFPVHNLDTLLNYATISEAIAANETVSGNTIFVEKGVYYEDIACSKNLTLIGEDKDATIIDGSGMGTVVQLGSYASITNFTVRNGEYGVRTGPLWYEIPVPQFTGNSIINNIIIDNVYGGILLWCSANNTVTDNTVANNTLFGINIHISADNLIINNTVMNNGHGIDFYSNSNGNVLRNNNLTNNRYNFGLLLRGTYYSSMGGSPSSPGLVNDVDASNTINGKPIYYWVDKQDAQIPLDAGFVWLTGCNNITIRNLSISDNIQGILLLWTNNTLVDSNTITHNAYGIVTAYDSRNNTLLNNVLVDNVNGVYLGEFSRLTVMRNNSISGGRYNFGVSPWEPGFIIGSTSPTDVMGGLNDVDVSNTVDGKPIVYWIGQHDLNVPSNAGYVMLINCTNIAVEGLSLSNNLQNVLLVNSNNTLISNNTISDSANGVWVRSFPQFSSATISWTLQPFFNITIKGNTFLDNGVACKLEEGDCLILNNTLYNNPLGIYLHGTSNSVVAGNVVVASNLTITRLTPYPDLYVFYYPQQYWELSAELNGFLWGGIIASGNANVIYDNTVEDSFTGISTADITRLGFDNVVCHNNLINNNIQAQGPQQNNWDFGYPSGGNYWSDYTGVDVNSGPNQDQLGSDGIGDTPYAGIRSVSRDNYPLDNYPLMSPYTDLYDIAIAYPLTTRPVFRWPDETINVSINVTNLSVEAETFNATLQANSTMIAAFQNISVAPGKSVSITYEWNVTSLSYGKYLINASVTPVPNETRISDNTRAMLIIHTIPGDLNEDRTVNSDDARILADQFGLAQNQPTWVSNADLNGDGEVDIFDAVILAGNFGRTW